VSGLEGTESVMNILIVDHIVKDRHQEAHSQAHRYRLSRALRAERRARRASESAREASESARRFADRLTLTAR
jgi:hypothetical protein